MKNVIVIPVYKERPNQTELVSLRQCLKILYRHDICFVAPEGLNTAAYQTVFQEYQISFKIEFFEPEFFKNLVGYSRLMQSKHFYERFVAYDYMLIYQLDAYVFRDELDDWCAKGYDYIGAPLIMGGKLDKKNIGNGGFSLRKISAFLDLFSHQGKMLTLPGLIHYHRFRGPLHRPWAILSGLFGKNNTLEAFVADDMFEDVFYSALRYKRGTKFKIPDWDEAMFFSFDGVPSELFQKNGNHLPFGCHAWYKIEYDSFWKYYISIE